MKPSLSPDELAAFLVEAKRRTYAAQGDDASVPPLLPNSKQLEYRHGDLHSFWGAEEITRAGVVVYRLRYHGGVVR